jgi:hypothetical protein
MNCKEIEHNIIDFIDNNLSIEEANGIENHINSCGSCKIRYDETLVLFRDLGSVVTQSPSDDVRANFYSFLEEEKQLESKKVIPLKKQPEVVWKRAFQVAASIVLVFSGYFFGSLNTNQNTSQEILVLQEKTIELREGMMLAMIENQSPSKRIQAVNYTESFVKPDTKILEALVERMQYDSNNNVRLAAAEALSDYSESSLVKDAFIEALTVQKDPSIQIAIIQFLVKTQEKRAIEPMQRLLEHNETQPFVKEEIKSVISNII